MERGEQTDDRTLVVHHCVGWPRCDPRSPDLYKGNGRLGWKGSTSVVSSLLCDDGCGWTRRFRAVVVIVVVFGFLGRARKPTGDFPRTHARSPFLPHRASTRMLPNS